MSAAGSYEFAAIRDAQAEIKRLAAQAQGGWEKEARALIWCGMRDGMAILEAGSGPGFITEQLLALAPSSTITCVEIDHTLAEQARQRLQAHESGRVRFVERSITETGLEGGQFDIAFARYLFQHLPDPAAAVNEIYRLLKPGGKLIIHDVDDGLYGVFQPPLPEFAPVLEAFGRAQAARGGNRFIARSLPNLLKSAGFHRLEVDGVVTDSAEKGVEAYLRHIDPARMEPLVENGLLAREDFTRYRDALAAYIAQPEAYTVWVTLIICGEKPADA